MRTKGKYSPEKLKAVILYILSKCGAMEKEKLACLLYFIDFSHYEKYETSLTGAVYLKT